MIGDFLNQVLREFVARQRRLERVRSAVLQRFDVTLDFRADALRRSHVHDEVADALGEDVSNELCNQVKAVLRAVDVKSGNTGGKLTYRGLRARN